MTRVLDTLRNHALLASAAGLTHLPGTVTIVCRVPGIRRNGTTHPAVETYPIERWSEAELLAFERDPAFDVRFELESSSAPGADTADAVQDQGAGAPTPDLGAKPDGTGVSAPIARPGEPIVPAVLDQNRVAAIRGRLADLGLIFAAVPGQDPLAAFDFGLVREEDWQAVEALVGFRPSARELEAAATYEPPVVTPVAGTDLASAAPAGGLPPVAETATPPGTAAPIDRIAAIRAVLPQLVKPGDFTREGKPKIEVVEKLVGFDLNRPEIEAAQVDPVPPTA